MEVNLTKLRGESETTADEIMTLKHQKESLEKQVGSFDQERRKYLSEGNIPLLLLNCIRNS